jgi:hypothetical protein
MASLPTGDDHVTSLPSHLEGDDECVVVVAAAAAAATAAAFVAVVAVHTHTQSQLLAHHSTE